MSRKATNYAVAFAAGALGIAGVAIATPSPLSAAPVALLTAALKTAAASQITNVHYYRRGYYGRHHHRHGYVYPYQGYAYPARALAYRLQEQSLGGLDPHLAVREDHRWAQRQAVTLSDLADELFVLPEGLSWLAGPDQSACVPQHSHTRSV
jgi:hypothetical protein